MKKFSKTQVCDECGRVQPARENERIGCWPGWYQVRFVEGYTLRDKELDFCSRACLAKWSAQEVEP